MFEKHRAYFAKIKADVKSINDSLNKFSEDTGLIVVDRTIDGAGRFIKKGAIKLWRKFRGSNP